MKESPAEHALASSQQLGSLTTCGFWWTLHLLGSAQPPVSIEKLNKVTQDLDILQMLCGALLQGARGSEHGHIGP